MNLVIEAEALKALLKIPKAEAQALREKMKLFAADPLAHHGWVKSFGKGVGRIRHGDWRAVYQIEDQSVTVLIVKIGNRKEIYR